MFAGIVTTTRVTHASPSGAYAKVADRYWENDAMVKADGADTGRCPDIALQLVHMEPGNRFKDDAMLKADGADTQRCPDITLQFVYMEPGNRFKDDAMVKADGADTQRCPDIAFQLVYMEPGNRFKNDAMVKVDVADMERCPDIALQLVYMEPGNRFKNDAIVKVDGADTQRCPDIALQLVYMEPGNRFKVLSLFLQERRDGESGRRRLAALSRHRAPASRLLPGNNGLIIVILGGGRREFLPNTTNDEEGTQGRRTDGRNLIQEWQDDKQARNVSYRYVWNRDDLLEASDASPDYLLGLFEGSHMQYHMEANETTEPTLAELTEVAIKSLSRNEKGFFLFVEGGRIDHAHHDNQVELALDETIELSAAVARATELLSEEDSLIVVTSDHAHVMAINGYTRRGGDILGPSDDIGDDGVPYMTLSYTNGPGARVHENGVRPDVTQDDDYRGSTRWMTHSEVPLELETHGGDDVGVFARGVAHGMFSGLYEQSQLPHLMAYAACIGPGPHAPACSSASLASPRALT
ncbi:Alkaline phosphatase, partial [Operophtera brumata]